MTLTQGKKQKRQEAGDGRQETEIIIKPKIHYFCEVIMSAMKNDLTPNLQPPTSYAGFPCSLFREPCSENWYVDQRRTGWDAMFTFSGKERDQETGYGYFGARYYDSDLSIWLSVDPMARKYPSLSPYVYCANNPVKLVDPDGREIIAEDQASRTNIKNTLTKDEAKFVRFDKNGNLDTKRLNKSKSESENMTALKALANSETKYRFSVASKDKDGESFYNEGSKPNNPTASYKGVAHIPNNSDKPSPDNDVHIIVSSLLNEAKAVETTAHEAYGHAYLYELKQQGLYDGNLNHTYSAELNKDGACCVFVPSNHALENQITKTTNQANANYQSRKRKK